MLTGKASWRRARRYVDGRNLGSDRGRTWGHGNDRRCCGGTGKVRKSNGRSRNYVSRETFKKGQGETWADGNYQLCTGGAKRGRSLHGVWQHGPQYRARQVRLGAPEGARAIPRVPLTSISRFYPPYLTYLRRYVGRRPTFADVVSILHGRSSY